MYNDLNGKRKAKITCDGPGMGARVGDQKQIRVARARNSQQLYFYGRDQPLQNHNTGSKIPFVCRAMRPLQAGHCRLQNDVIAVPATCT